MKYIQKNPSKETLSALNSFIQRQRKAGIAPIYEDFKPSDGRKILQKNLLEDQGYLCAYCMKRINHAEKIEHWKDQTYSKDENNNEETLDYNNLFAVCNGISIASNNRFEHCDQSRSKSNRKLTINPTDARVIRELKYLKNGIIYHTSKNIAKEAIDITRQNDIDTDIHHPKSLNLNNLVLVDNRKRVYEDVKKIIDIKCRNKTESQAKSIIQKEVEKWKCLYQDNKEDKPKYQFKEYCEIVVFFFDR